MAIVFLFLLAFTVEAQLLHEQDLLLQPAELLDINLSETGNDAFIQQIGNSNELELIQVQNGNFGNLTRALQSGDWNIALITQDGQNNQLALIQQGDLNLFELINTGEGNKLVTIQQGSGNTVNQELIQSNQIYSEMIQIGNDNEIQTVIEAVNNSEFKVRQIGNGLKVIIRETGY
ncbi:MAG: hypothetical protein R2825_07645 [Saprospiraceae bacterium]